MEIRLVSRISRKPRPCGLRREVSALAECLVCACRASAPRRRIFYGVIPAPAQLSWARAGIQNRAKQTALGKPDFM